MRTGLLLVCGWLVISLQTSALTSLPGVPELYVPLALYLGFTRESLRAALLAGVLGYLTDLLGGSPRGLHVLLAMMLAFLASAASNRLMIRGPLLIVVLTFLASLIAQLLGLTLVAGLLPGFRQPGLLLSGMLPTALATALFAPPAIWLCRKVDRVGRKKARREDGLLGP